MNHNIYMNTKNLILAKDKIETSFPFPFYYFVTPDILMLSLERNSVLVLLCAYGTDVVSEPLKSWPNFITKDYE